MNKSESIKELATALSKAQGEYKGAIKSAINPAFKRPGESEGSKYANLEADFQCIQEPFAKHGLSFTQGVVKGEPYLGTTIMHSSGEWITEYVPFKPPEGANAQLIKAFTTYAKRNGLEAAAGIPSTDDDDGNEAAGKEKPKEPTKPKAEPQKPHGEAPKQEKSHSMQHSQAIITDAQRKRLFAIASSNKWTEAMIKESIQTLYGIDSTKKLNRHDYDDLISKIEGK